MALISILYWLSLATWFGSAVFLAVAAPTIIRTVRDHDPLLPTVLSVNLERQHAALLAGSIVRNLLISLTRLSYLCAGGLLIALVGEWIVVARGGLDLVLPLLRSALFIAAAVFMIYDARFVRPRIEEARRTFVDHADEPDVANPALDLFERYGRESVTVLQTLIFMLLGLVVFSAIGLARGMGQTVLF